MEASFKDSSSLYLGYGSNLWQDQMRRRCPESCYLGIARLEDFRWIINGRGYANVVPAPPQPQHTQSPRSDDRWSRVVYGLAYGLSKQDEDALDRNEGVPWAYTKEIMTVDFWPAGEPDGPVQKRDMLVYIDRKRTEGEFEPKEEYIHRMNQGIEDALKEGVPKGYVQTVLRHYIPEAEVDDAAKAVARSQSDAFVDSTTPR